MVYFSEISISGELQVGLGSELRLECTASGANYPPERVDWFKDDEKIEGFNIYNRYERASLESRTLTSTLRKSTTEMNDAGNYTCRSSEMMVASVTVEILEGVTTGELSYWRVPQSI